MTRRFSLVAVAVAGLAISACGESSTATTSSVASVSDSTAFPTIPVTESTSTTTTLPGSGGTAGQVTTEVTEYTVQSGDVPFTVALKFNVTLEALELANADTEGWGAFFVGLKIKIPAGATIPDPSATTTTVGGGTPAQTTTTIAGGGDNCAAGTYVIQEGDLPGRVAAKFDVTLEQLDAANVNTQGYKAFIVGVTIIIPAKTGC